MRPTVTHDAPLPTPYADIRQEIAKLCADFPGD